MKIKLLRRFCADEVKLLLERMDEHFVEEFVIDDSKWDSLIEGDGFDRFTSIEKYCISTEYRAHLKKFRKAVAYQEILERAMSPAKTRWEYREEKEGFVKQEAEQKKMLISRAQYEMAQKLLQQQAQFIPPQPSTMLDPYTQNIIKQ
jgi:hypothetical protein